MPGLSPIRQTFKAKRNRLSSPPEAMRFKGPAGAPGLVATVKVTLSTPSGPASAKVISVVKTARSIFSGASSLAIARSSRLAEARRASVRAAASRR